MKQYEHKITRFIKSRPCTLLAAIAAIVAICVAQPYCEPLPAPHDTGLIAQAARWVLPSAATLGISLALMICAMTMLVVINRSFNLLRTTSLMFVGLYMVMQCATPAASVQILADTVINILILWTMLILYSAYQSPKLTRRLFLAFCILAAGGLWQYALAAYIPVMIIGCVQMRCLTPRTLLAALIGIITPAWIAWGLGLVSLYDFRLPSPPPLSQTLHNPAAFKVLCAAAFTIIAGIILTVTNLVKVYSYNAKARAVNGLFATVTIFTLIFCIADIANISAYISTLNCCIAVQAALFFRINAERRGYLPILLMTAAYIAFYTWNLWD